MFEYDLQIIIILYKLHDSWTKTDKYLNILNKIRFNSIIMYNLNQFLNIYLVKNININIHWAKEDRHKMTKRFRNIPSEWFTPLTSL